MKQKEAVHMYLPRKTLEALDHAREDLDLLFNRSELANLAIREGLPRVLPRFQKFPNLIVGPKQSVEVRV